MHQTITVLNTVASFLLWESLPFFSLFFFVPANSIDPSKWPRLLAERLVGLSVFKMAMCGCCAGKIYHLIPTSSFRLGPPFLVYCSSRGDENRKKKVAIGVAGKFVSVWSLYSLAFDARCDAINREHSFFGEMCLPSIHTHWVMRP